MPMISVKLAILIFVTLEVVSLDFPWSFHKHFIFDLHKHLSYRGIERM